VTRLRMVIVLVTLWIAMSANLAVANEKVLIERVTPGVKTEYWTLEKIELQTIHYGPWQIAAINHCQGSSATCSVSKEVQYCTSVSISGSVKVGIEVIESELGFEIGRRTYCESTECSVTCPGNTDAVLEWRYVKPVKAIIQRKHIVYPDGHEELGERTYAYVVLPMAPECRSYCKQVG